MTDEFLKMAEECGIALGIEMYLATPDEIIALCKKVQDMQREKLAQWMIYHGYSTGHGDTIEDLLTELQAQISNP